MRPFLFFPYFSIKQHWNLIIDFPTRPFPPKYVVTKKWYYFEVFSSVVELNGRNTGGPLDMRILGLGKTRISGKSHSENQKVVVLYCKIFLMYEIKITFAAVCLLINYYMIYKTN